MLYTTQQNRRPFSISYQTLRAGPIDTGAFEIVIMVAV
jgi:hypothetical protein